MNKIDQPLKIIARINFDNETVSITGEIPSEDWAKLLRFRDEAKHFLEELKKCENLNVNFVLEWNHAVGLSSKTTNIKSQDLALILLRLRPFMLNNEPYEFNRIINLFQRYVRHKRIVEYLGFLKDEFSGKVFQSQIQITSGEFLVNCEKMLWTWLNAYEFHRRDEERRLIQEIDASLPADLSRAIFASMIIDKVKAVSKFTGLISSFNPVTE